MGKEKSNRDESCATVGRRRMWNLRGNAPLYCVHHNAFWLALLGKASSSSRS